MCVIPIYKFPCGHELRHPVQYCPSWHPSDPRSNKLNCGTVSFEPVAVASKCVEEGCRFWNDRFEGQWKCCRCKMGPNAEARCVFRVEVLLSKHDCGHRFCDGCTPWKESGWSKLTGLGVKRWEKKMDRETRKKQKQQQKEKKGVIAMVKGKGKGKGKERQTEEVDEEQQQSEEVEEGIELQEDPGILKVQYRYRPRELSSGERLGGAGK